MSQWPFEQFRKALTIPGWMGQSLEARWADAHASLNAIKRAVRPKSQRGTNAQYSTNRNKWLASRSTLHGGWVLGRTSFDCVQ